MKKLLIVAAFMLILTSCSKQDNSEPTIPPTPGRFTNNSFKWDTEYSTYLVNESMVKMHYDIFGESGASLMPNGRKTQDLVVTNLFGMYPSAIYPKASIRNGLLNDEFINEKNRFSLLFQSNQIIYIGNWGVNANATGYGDVLTNVIASDGYKNHTNKTGRKGLSYQMVEIYALSDIKSIFSGSSNAENYFSAQLAKSSKKQERNSLMFASLSQFNLRLFFDLGQNNLFKLASNNQKDNYAYVSNMIYGNLGYVLIESSDSYQDVSTAFDIAVTYGFDFDKMLADGRKNSVDLLSASKVVFYSLDNRLGGNCVVDNLDAATDFFNAEYDKESLGVPLYAEFNNLKDNTTFIP